MKETQNFSFKLLLQKSEHTHTHTQNYVPTTYLLNFLLSHLLKLIKQISIIKQYIKKTQGFQHKIKVHKHMPTFRVQRA